MPLLPLEEMLRKQSANQHDFPAQKDYFATYTNIKDWMTLHVFSKIDSGLSAADGNIYTSHGPDHFERVIKYAGLLLGLKNNGMDSKTFSLSPFETYVLLVSILLHDSGNMFGREGHEKRAGLIICKMGELAGTTFEKRIISQIAQAHGGKTADGSKDTIGKLNTVENLGSCSCRSKLIAAITRFADEICEDHTRAASFSLENYGVPEKNIIYHKYAASIQSVDIDLNDESVSVSYSLDKNDVLECFHEGDAKSKYLIDEIIYRLKKMDCERKYIMRFTSGTLLLHKIKAEVEIWDNDDGKYDRIKHVSVLIEEEGHPIEALEEGEGCPSWIPLAWTGENLAKYISEEASA